MRSTFIRGLAAASLLATAMSQSALAQEGQGRACYGDGARCCYNPDLDGPVNTYAYPFCEDYLARAQGAERYETLDRTRLARTQICRPGVECGPPADLSNIKPFFAETGVPAPAQPVATAPPPPPPPAPVVTAPPAPVVTAPPVITGGGSALPGTGLAGAAPLALGGLALAGIIALAVHDDDDAAATSTTP